MLPKGDDQSCECCEQRSDRDKNACDVGHISIIDQALRSLKACQVQLTTVRCCELHRRRRCLTRAASWQA
jgi:hypothetical protein